MKKLSMPICCLCFFFVMTTCFLTLEAGSSAFAERAEPLRLAWDPWPPYQFIDNKGRLTGLDIEIVSAAAGNADWELSYKELPGIPSMAVVKRFNENLARLKAAGAIDEILSKYLKK